MTAKSAPTQTAGTIEQEMKSDKQVLDDVLAQSIYASLANKGDLSELNEAEKTSYMRKLCEAVGLNPLTMPFLPLKLNGKEVFYATRNATDQLTNIHSLSRDIIKTETIEGVYIATAKVSGKDGRFEISTGAVAIKNLAGDALANALMKAETKAKRRGTLSYCGLGFLDESEIDTIPRERFDPPTKGQLVENARSAAAAKEKPAPPVGRELSEKELKWLEEIKTLMRQTGFSDVALDNAVRTFLDNPSKRESGYVAVMRKVVEKTIESDKWPYTEEGTTEYLEGYGITAVADASFGQLEPLIDQMRQDGIIS